MNSINQTNCILGPWDQKRNFSWANVDNVNIGAYMSYSLFNKCPDIELEPAIYEIDLLVLSEPGKTSIKSASSNSSKNTQSELKDSFFNNSANIKHMPNKELPRNTTCLTKKIKNNQLSIAKNRKNCSNSLSNVDSRLSQIETKIDSDLVQLRTGQTKNDIIDSSKIIKDLPIKRTSIHNIQNLENIQKFDILFGERSSNYNPSTLYRLKKLHDYTRNENRKNLPTNLIATLDTNTDKNKVFDTQKECSCCTKQIYETKSRFSRNQINVKLSNSECGCSDLEIDTSSDSSTGECKAGENASKIPETRLTLRTKSVQLLHNKNYQFTNSDKNLMTACKSLSSSQMPSIQPILKINKFISGGSNNNQNSNSLKRFSAAAAANRKLIENETSIHKNRNLINRNSIELDESINDNSFNSVLSRTAVQSPCVNNMKNSCILKKIGGVTTNPSFLSKRYGLSNGNYSEAISVSGKSFLSNETPNYSFSNKPVIAPKTLRQQRQITSAESEIRDIQINFNQLAKIDVK